MRKITKAEMRQLYEEGMLFEVVTLGDVVIARNVKGQGDNPRGFEVVYCEIQVSASKSLVEKVKGLLK